MLRAVGINYFLEYLLLLTEELADALLADEIRKSSVTSLTTQAQVHAPFAGSSTEPGTSGNRGQGIVTSTPRSVSSGVSGDSGIVVGSGETSGESVEKIQHQLAITTQELMETKEALDESEKKRKELEELGGTIRTWAMFKIFLYIHFFKTSSYAVNLY